MWKGIFKLKVRNVELDLIPYVGQLELPNVPVEEWITDPDIHSILDIALAMLCNFPSTMDLSTLAG